MATDKEIKKKVTEDWLNSFPHLSPFAQNKLYKIIGCLIFGIEAVNVPNIEGYKPHIVIYPLWMHDVKKCLDTPSLYICIVNKKGLQFSIPYSKHNQYFNEALECFKNQNTVSLNGNVSLKSLFAFIDSLFSDMLIKTNSMQQAKLFELKFHLALYVGSQVQIQNVLTQIQQARKSWDMQMFETWYGSFDLWVQRLLEKASRRDEFLDQVEINKQDKKIAKLQNSELTE
ncbi:hypothetical protein [Sphingobacterium sp.]|uniref:hypothetical protein n=1 Tax=Sphingobacterium sp. TaxID=341027 RepID=UPI0028A24725|nr:hypothetical protein [Sphingobacterium sp.]